MDPEVNLLLTLGLLLLPHIRLMLVVNEVDNRRPRVPVVHVVTESGAVNDGEFSLELLLLELSLNNLDLGELVKLLIVTFGVRLGR